MLVKAVPGGLSPRAHLEALAGYAMSDYEYYVSVMGLLGTFGLLVVVWGCRICREGELADKSAARGNAAFVCTKFVCVHTFVDTFALLLLSEM